MKVVGCILVVVWAFAGVTGDVLTAETSDVSRMSVLDPHQHRRQHLRSEIRRLEESENIEPEERDRRINCLQEELRHRDRIEQHHLEIERHQEMLMRMREHERERQARFERERQEQTHQNSRTVGMRELERRKRAYKENRAENGREMRKWLDTQKKLHEGRKDKEGRKYTSWIDRNVTSSHDPDKEGRKYTSWIDAWKSVIRRQYEQGDVRLKIVCALALLYVGILVRDGWRNVKSFIAHKNAAVAYEDKYGNMHPCAFCGQMKSAIHSVYHSVFRRTDGGAGEYIDRCGLAVYACDRCLKIHRLRHLIFSVLHNIFIAMLVLAVGFWCVEGCVLITAPALQMDCPFPMWLNGAIAVVCICIIFALYMLHRRLTDFFHPWKRLVGRHPVVLELLKSGYKLDDDWLRLVGEGLDTDRRSRTISRGKAGMAHETYCWMGVLKDFNSDGIPDPKAEEALRYMRDMEQGRVAPCRVKVITLEQAVVGVIFLIYIAIVIVMMKLLMK